MTGWRCGWTIASPELTKVFNTIEGQTTSNITSVTQKAALAALSGSQEPVRAMRDEFGTTFIFSTHDPRVMAEAEVTFRLEDGRLADAGPVAAEVRP